MVRASPEVRKIAMEMMNPEQKRRYLAEEAEEDARDRCRAAMPTMTPEEQSYWQQRLNDGTVTANHW